jgi:hypothetical protein
MHRLMLLSNTYRQSSLVSKEARLQDADNRLLSRMPRRRLEAEAIRDSLLMASGKLDRRAGGLGDRDPLSQRRAIYQMTIRSEKTGFCPLFDAADPTSIVEKRVTSTVAPQALYLLNSDFALEQAQALADRLLTAQPKAGAEERIQWLYQTLFGREAKAEERSIGLGFVQGAGAERELWRDYTHLLLCSNEFIYID